MALTGALVAKILAHDTLGLEHEKHVRLVPNALVVASGVFLALVIVPDDAPAHGLGRFVVSGMELGPGIAPGVKWRSPEH